MKHGVVVLQRDGNNIDIKINPLTEKLVAIEGVNKEDAVDYISLINGGTMDSSFKSVLLKYILLKS